MLKRVRKLNAPGGWAIELSVDSAAEIHDDVEGAIKAYKPRLDGEFRRLAKTHDVDDLLRAAVNSALKTEELDAKGFRHRALKDALFDNTLYQLVDYYPGPKQRAGRRFSHQFGMIGRAWRREESLYQPDVPVEKSTLIDEWGMTDEQASNAGRGQQSFVCVVLRHGDINVGLLYADAEPQNAFGSDVTTRLEQHAAKLIAAVGEVHQVIRGKGPKLATHDSG